MVQKEELKANVCREIDNRKEEAISLAKAILKCPELGFREINTAKLISRKFAELGLPHRTEISLTGVKGSVSGGNPGPSVCIIGELDSLIVNDHPYADKNTGAAHACGHNVQIAMMYSVAAAIMKAGVLPSLTGRVIFIAVPAEEGIEIEYRYGLIKQGKLHYTTGKPEFIRLGEMDDVDVAMMTHTNPSLENKKIAAVESINGVIRKKVQFIGKSAHAGSQPHKGINALNAAMIALNSINAQRETFQDADTIRVHPIITKGGDVVNVVPADVRMESYVRGKTNLALLDANEKVNRALRAGAMAVGAKVNIITIPGSRPLVFYPELWNTYKENVTSIISEEEIGNIGHMTGSSDIGDVSQIIPTIQPFCAGATGTPHGNDYLITDYDIALINPAKAMAMTVIDLLSENAIRAREIMSKNKPPMTKEQYIKSLDSLFSEEEYQG